MSAKLNLTAVAERLSALLEEYWDRLPADERTASIEAFEAAVAKVRAKAEALPHLGMQ